MQTVGIRELKAKLSKYLRYARKGEVVLVTDRGRVVAEIRSPRGGRQAPSELAGLQDLIDRGIVSEGGPNDPALYPPAPVHLPPGTAKRLLDEERGER